MDKNEKSSITVTTAEELKKAINAHYDQIVITGPLAERVKKAEKIKKLSPAVLAMIGGLGALAAAALAVAPAAVFVPGAGPAAVVGFAAAAAPAAAASGLSIPVLLVVAGVGVAGMSMLFDDYLHIEVSPGKMIFERKRKSKGEN